MTWADQQTLNKFATDNNRRHALNAEIAGLKVRVMIFSFLWKHIQAALHCV